MVHNLTVAVDDELWEQMQRRSEIRWGVVMKNAAREKLEALRVLDSICERTRLSEDEILKHSLELGGKVNRR
jgi:S-adenosylmethionine:diacylglycerol 3-amino-3-carboxypropyl transferase